MQETCGNGSCVGGETPGVCPRDCPLSGYVHVPAGQSVMGAPSDEPGYAADEGPQRRVTLSHGFLLKATEVTQAEWTALMGNAPSSFSACGDDCPVENVNWWEALAYCNALSEAEGLPSCYTLTGCGATSPGEGMTCTGVSVTAAGGDPLLCKGYRLPTEAEWEHAVRSGTETATYQGPLTVQGERDAPELDAIAWYGGNSGVSYAGGTDCSSWTGTADPASTCGTHPVGQKTANGWGLYDMVGNVSEWVWDWYGGSHYGTRPDPDSDPPGPASGSQRGLRGGAWLSVVADSRSAARDSGAPSSAADHVGFRPARSVIKTLSCTNDSDCDDGNICSADDCSSGVCTHAPYGCDDSDPCTVGSCFAATCNYTPTDCDDGLSCTVDSCDAQGCRHDPYICDDGDACTDDYCEEPNRTCSAAPSATLGQPCDGTDSDQCANGTYTCKADRSGFECTNEAPSDIAETCDGTDEDCDGVTDNGFEKDTSHSGDFPDSWSTNLPEVARYATTTSGTISGHILPSGDSDWFSIRATEDDTRRCSQTGWSDVRIKGDVTFTAPADASLRVCACFSSSSSKCSRSGTDCSTVAAGSSVDLAVEVNNMSCWSTDTAYLDIEVSAPSGPGWSCTDWRVDWVISE